MNHKQQKDAARAEAIDHLRSNVNMPRGGMDHEDHKNRDKNDSDDDIGMKVLNRQSSDRMPRIDMLNEPKVESYRS